MRSRAFEGPPTAHDMDDAVMGLLFDNRLVQARELAVTMVDYWSDRDVRAAYRAAGDPFSIQEQFYYWLGIRSAVANAIGGRTARRRRSA